ncbi:MAG: polysaccharide biosynthesis tyrosine autokinase [bacterium]
MSKIEQALAKAAQRRRTNATGIPDSDLAADTENDETGSDTGLKQGRLKSPSENEPQNFIPELLPPDVLANLDSRLIALFSSTSMASEQYRLLRTKILRSFKLYSHNAFLISSSLPSEGKTTTAICLAISIAQSLQNTVILVDADLRRPSIHGALGIKIGSGLSDHLTQQIPLEKVIQKTCIPKLSVITSGTIPPNPSELILSDRMTNMLTELKNRYSDRIILVDSPPIISITDSVILSQKLDGVILVVHTGKTPKVAIKETIESLGDSNILGVVLNHLDSHSGYYKKYKYKYNKYGYRYGNKYGYGYGNKYGYGYGYKSPDSLKNNRQ